MIPRLLPSSCLLIALALPGFAQAQDDLNLFLLIGQSNMAGRGVIGEEDKLPIPGVFVLRQDLDWKPAIDPLHFDKPQIAGVGIGRSFAKSLQAARPGAQIGLIPAAMGGSSLDEWGPGGKLYSEAIRRTRAAMKNGRLRGILWHQGESDSNDPALARSYRERWAKMIVALRRDLGEPDVPVVVGLLGEFLYTRPENKSPYAKVVNEQLATIQLDVPHTIAIPSHGLTHKGDVLHFDSASLHEFGRRYALGFMVLDQSWKQ